MRKFKVEFLPLAERDLVISFEWGVSYWGKAAARKWLNEFNSICRKRLGLFPSGCAIATESEELGR